MILNSLKSFLFIVYLFLFFFLFQIFISWQAPDCQSQNDGYSENDDTPDRYGLTGGGNLGHGTMCQGFWWLTDYNPKYKSCEQLLRI